MVRSDFHEQQPHTVQEEQPVPIGSDASGGRPAGCLLIVEPEALLRWSLVTYLKQWFEVLSAETKVAADQILDRHRIDAIVVSDELSEAAMEEIEAHARSRNEIARVVRTVTTERTDQMLPKDTCCVEKPFELAKLARLLGVE